MTAFSLPSTVADPRAERIVRSLRYIGAGPAGNFLDACRLMAAAPRLPTTTHLVGHLMREVESALRDVAGPAAGGQAPTPRRERCPTCGQEPPSEAHATAIRRVLAWLGIPDSHPAAHAWLELTGRSNPNALHKRAHRDNLNAPRPVDADFEGWWDRLLDVLDTVLARVEERYGDVFARIDRLVAEGATAARTKIGLQIPTTFVTQEYLVAQLGQLGAQAAADWLDPLRDAAFFRWIAPPASSPEHELGASRFWPQAEYLSLVAPVRPAEVRAVIAAVQTDDANVRRQLLRAALALPPAEASHLVPAARVWVRAFGRGYGEPDAARFAAHVLGDPAAAVPVADALFETAGVLLGLEDDPGAQSTGLPWRRRGRDVASTFDVLVPALLAFDARRAIALLAAALDVSIDADAEERRARYAPFLRQPPDADAPDVGTHDDEAASAEEAVAEETAADERPESTSQAPQRPSTEERRVQDGVPQSAPALANGAESLGRLAPPDDAQATPCLVGGPPPTFREHGLSFSLRSLATAGGVDAHRHLAHDTWELLAVGLRDAVLAAVASSACTPAEALDALLAAGHGLPPRAAGRIALAVLSRLPDADPGLVAAWLLNPVVGDDYSLRAEYDALLTAGYRVLDPVDREGLAAQLAAEPLPTWYGSVEPDVEAAAVAARRRDRLAPLRGQLPPVIEAYLGDLVAQHGEPDRSDQGHIMIAEWTGPRTPVTAETLAAMPADDLVGYLQGWAPEESATDPATGAPFAARRTPTHDGLAGTLERVIAADPARYAGVAPALADTQPVYIRAALQAFRTALGDDRAFPWPGPLALCAAVAGAVGAASLEAPGTGQSDDGAVEAADDGAAHARGVAEEWRSARRAAASLLGAGLAYSPGTRLGVPAATRADVWAVLERLADDPDPTPGGEQDGIMPSSVRATAIEAVVAYAVWAAEASVEFRSDGSAGGIADESAGADPSDAEDEAGEVDPGGPPRGFAVAPEAAQVLAAHARWERDPSLAVRAAFGRCLGQLAAFDPGWVSAHMDAILPAGPDRAAARGALTATYLMLTHPSPAALPVLDPIYRHVIATAGADHEVVAALDASVHGGIAERGVEELAVHLAGLSWSGAASLDDAEGVLAAFFRSAGPDARQHLLSTLGLRLNNAQANGAAVPADVCDRLMRLWDARAQANEDMEVSPAADPAAVRGAHRELTAFGWWFASAQLDVTWRLARLEQALRLAGAVEPDTLAAEALAACAAAFPASAVACLARLDLDRGGPTIGYAWREAAADICRAALASGDASAVERANAVIGRWAARGHTELLALRSTAAPTAESPDAANG